MFCSLQRERHVVGGVAGRRDRLERPAVAAHHLAVGERAVGTKIRVVAGVEPRRLADMQRPRGAMRAFGQTCAPVAALMRRHAGRMVAVGVGDEDVRDGLAAHRVEQRLDVRARRPGPGSMIATLPRPTM